MVDFIERREYFRIRVDCEINYRFIGNDEFHKARCSSLSGGGISFTTEHEIELAKILEVIIQPQLASTPPMRAHVKVVRVQTLEDQTYEIGASMIVQHDNDYFSF